MKSSRNCAPASENSLKAEDPGILVFDKPAGVTSHDVVAQVRRERSGKVGHAGTLDPFATGVLTVLLGRATRLQRYLLGLSKTYVATARLGWRSSTGDSDGELTETGVIPSELSLPTGEIEQMVPMTSAVKVDGERLYKRAHRGEEDNDRPVRTVDILRAELLESDAERATFEVECSSGTYVRTLIETLGDAYCEELRRTAVGPIGIDRAGDVLTPLEALSFLPQVEISPSQATTVGYGQTLAAPGDLAEGEPVLLVNGDNLTAVASRSGDKLKAEVVMEPQG